LFCGAVLLAQAPATPSFEVASVKANKSVGANVVNGYALPGDRLEVTNATVVSMIGVAYGKPGRAMVTFADQQIIGGPDWIRTDRFDMSAKANQDESSQKLLMLRTLLAERFRLTVHEERRQDSIYALAMARNDRKLGPRLHQSETDCAALPPAASASDQRCS